MIRLSAIAAALVLAGAASPALANLALAQKHACTACHAVDKKVVGPAYADVAKKYANQKDIDLKMQEFFAVKLLGADAPSWMRRGIPFLEKGRDQVRPTITPATGTSNVMSKNCSSGFSGRLTLPAIRPFATFTVDLTVPS